MRLGFTNAKIYASNDLDESLHPQLKNAKQKLIWGVGTKLITTRSIVSVVENEAGEMISHHVTQVSRDRRITRSWVERGHITYDGSRCFTQLTELKMFHPLYLHQTVRNFEAIPLFSDVFLKGAIGINYHYQRLKEYLNIKLRSIIGMNHKRVLNPQHYQLTWQNTTGWAGLVNIRN